MTRMAVAGCMALAALGAVAVLDVGSRAAQAEPNVSPFAGSWSGTWSIAASNLNERGTFDWTISDAGRITGTVTGGTDLAGGAVVGHVGADGKLGFVGYAGKDVPIKSFPFQGTAVIDGDGKLVVSAFHMAWEGAVHHLIATLERN